jgi:TRAP-type C4-dicarboxylate transport system permease small subunit
MFHTFAALGRVLSAIAVASLTALIAAEVVGRTLFGISIESVEELSSYLLVGITFLSAADSFASGSFMRVDILYVRLSRPARMRLDRWLAALATLISAGITWYLAQLVWSSWAKRIVSPGALAIPLWIPQAVMVLGMLLLTIACMRHAIFPSAEIGPSSDSTTN